MTRALLALIVLSFITDAAHAAPPPNADASLVPWFESLSDANGRSCCGRADGHILHDDQWRTTPDGYQVLIRGRWVPVPSEAVIARNNPTGQPVAFYGAFQDTPIYCFVLPPLG